MAAIKPFGALRFTEKAGTVGELVCPPYDIISEKQREAYLKSNPRNIIRLELPREGADPYAQAGETLKNWLKDGILATDGTPAIYIYEEEFKALGNVHRVKGFTCRVKLEEFDKGIVLPHEETLSKAKADRFNLMCATSANFSSIYSLYFDCENSVYGIIDTLSNGKPDVEFIADDGVIQRLWITTDAEAIKKITALMEDKKIYIADGHHRYETALNYRRHLLEQGQKIDADHPANYIMMTLMNMEHEGLVVFPTHRIVRGLNSFDGDGLIENCKQYFDVSDCELKDAESVLDAHAKAGRKAFGMYYDKRVRLLTLKDNAVMNGLLPDKSNAYRNLDVSILHTLVLERLLHIDRENLANQKNLVYTRDIPEAVTTVDKGEADCAFIINATRVDEIAAVAGAGEKMPQKSTYFYPKIITGLTMNLLD